MNEYCPLYPQDSSAYDIRHQFPHDQLVNFLHNRINEAGAGGIAVLIVVLKQANRMNTLTGSVSFESIKHHTDQLLDRFLRSADRYTNLSDEQICLVLPGLASKDQAVLAAIRLLAEFQKPFNVGEHRILLRPHIGIASFPEFGRDARQLLMFADIASNISATDEKGYHVYRIEDHVETEFYSGLDVELALAITNNELRVHFQPQIDISTGKCISAEALVRWTTLGNREINPGVLVGIAENCGLIGPMTIMILNTALRHTANFAAAGIDIGISVNLPPQLLDDEDLTQVIQQSLDIWGVPPSRLTLEITEGSVIKNASSLVMLASLRELGINLALDDFGTGYSSLAYLKQFQVQELKIDIIFIRNIHKSRGDKQLVQAIIDLAHNFDMITVAEGVEDQETYELLKEMGCDMIQGWLFSKAIPENDLIKWYRKHNDLQT